MVTAHGPGPLLPHTVPIRAFPAHGPSALFPHSLPGLPLKATVSSRHFFAMSTRPAYPASKNAMVWQKDVFWGHRVAGATVPLRAAASGDAAAWQVLATLRGELVLELARPFLDLLRTASPSPLEFPAELPHCTTNDPLSVLLEACTGTRFTKYRVFTCVAGCGQWRMGNAGTEGPRV